MVGRRIGVLTAALTCVFASPACSLDDRRLKVAPDGAAAENDGGAERVPDGDAGDAGDSDDANDSGDAGTQWVVRALSASGDGTCALLQDRRVACWGDYGGTRSAEPLIVPGIEGAIAVSAGDPVCALLSDVGTNKGWVSCWSANGTQFGGGTPDASTDPVRVGNLADAMAIATGGVACAVDSGGSVWCWGDNRHGAFGDLMTSGMELCDDGITSSCSKVPVHVPGVEHAKAVAVGEAHVCALKDDSTVWCWGDSESGSTGTVPSGDCTATLTPTACLDSPHPVAGLGDVTAIAAGGGHTCAVEFSGSVFCWGDNSSGWLGNGTFAGSAIPVKVSGLGQAKSISVSRDRSCATNSDGSVACWGDNFAGSLGWGATATSEICGSTTCSTRPLPVKKLTTAMSVAVGENHVCALLVDGSVDCWGANNAGQLGPLMPPDTCRSLAGGDEACSTTPITVAFGACSQSTCKLGETRCGSSTSLETCQPAGIDCAAFTASPCPSGQVCEDTAPACVDPNWAQWPMPNDALSGAPNRQTYRDNHDTTVTDLVTGLTWAQTVTLQPLILKKATDYCATLTAGHAHDWRLPSIVELQSLVDYARESPAIDVNFFSGTPNSGVFWSATALPGPAELSWAVSFAEGVVDTYPQGSALYVRCVR